MTNSSFDKTVHPLNQTLRPQLQQKIDSKTKPLGALGQLEEIALRLGLIQESLTPQLDTPTIVLFAGDHGIVAEGVSPYPQDVTYQMVYNFLAGGAAINVFAKQHGIDVVVVDAGVNHDFPAEANLLPAKIAYGTANALHGPAMSDEQREQALAAGANVVQDILDGGCNIVGFGEMGIGNTSSSAMLMSLLCNIPIADCVGRGTGLDDAGVNHKAAILGQTIEFHQQRWLDENIDPDALDILSAVGGFEITQMVGGMIQAASQKTAILVDGFISTAAFITALHIQPEIREYAFFTHRSNEKGHQMMLERLEAKPLLDIGMRLGEGSGAAVAYPLLVSATAFLNEMASFESAGVSEAE